MSFDNVSEAGRGLFNHVVRFEPLAFRTAVAEVLQFGQWTKDRFIDEDRFKMIRDRFVNNFWQKDDWT
ncbi:MAG: hypothetical protein LLG04_04755 [Parachlamydia sp.]|nr:hypothetical protein [Parachlamydia sp.]